MVGSARAIALGRVAGYLRNLKNLHDRPLWADRTIQLPHFNVAIELFCCTH